MKLFIGVAIPIAGILGALVGAWWSKRAASEGSIGALLNAEIDGMWSGPPGRTDAAIEVIRTLMESGQLSRHQMMEASIQLKHYAAQIWISDREVRRSIEEQDGPTR